MGGFLQVGGAVLAVSCIQFQLSGNLAGASKDLGLQNRFQCKSLDVPPELKARASQPCGRKTGLICCPQLSASRELDDLNHTFSVICEQLQ